MSIGQYAIIYSVIIMSRLKELRKEKGLTQVQMQMLTGIDQSDYSKIENGKRYYTFEQCKRIALALETVWIILQVSPMKKSRMRG